MEFTYHRHASSLRALMVGLAMAILFDAAIVVVLFVLLPPPWGYITAGIGLLLSAYAILSLTRVVRTRHRLLSDRLHLTFGRFRLEVPGEKLASAGLISSIPPSTASSAQMWPEYRPDDDTLYIVPHRTGLVQLRLTEPLVVPLSRSGQPVKCTRIVLALDDPRSFLEALNARATPGSQPVIPPRELEGERQPERPASRSPLPFIPRPGSSEGAAIALEHLTKRYGEFTAVHDVSLTVGPGEILAFLGSNGAGKSTTIRMMTGVLRPSEGRVLIHGRDLWKEGAEARRLVGYVPDTPLLYESLTAQEFLWFVGGLYELEPKQAKARAEELLAMLQMTDWRDQLIRGFSLGMRRKMSIAAALMHEPQVLLLDEVTNGLDPRSARVVKDLILAQAERGASVFLTTHILDVAGELAHRFAFIDRGRVLALGTKGEIERLLGLSNATLEELFLALTDASPEGSEAR